MEKNSIKKKNNLEEQEIDLIALVLLLWKKKKFIFKIVCISAIIGLVVAIIAPDEYTAKCVVVPDTNSGAFTNSSFGGLAALAGINFGSSNSGDMISPAMYESLLKNVKLNKELVKTPLNFKEYDNPVTILDYYTKKEYQKFSLRKFIRRYTIDLPYVIMELFSEKQDNSEIEPNIGEPFNLEAYTTKELQASSSISQKISIDTDPDNGSIIISAKMPEQVAAAQVVKAVTSLLQKYVIELKLQKAEVNYNFIKQRYDESKALLDAKQEAYAKYLDANKVLSSAVSIAKGEQIKNEYEVASSLFDQLTAQLVQAEMKIKEDLPILTIVEPVTVPLHKSGPNVPIIMLIFIFIGGIIACILVFCASWLLNVGIENKWAKYIIV